MDPSNVYHPVRVPLACPSVLIDFRHHCFPGLNLMIKEQEVIKSTEEIDKLYSEPQISTRKPLPCLVCDQFAPVAG